MYANNACNRVFLHCSIAYLISTADGNTIHHQQRGRCPKHNHAVRKTNVNIFVTLHLPDPSHPPINKNISPSSSWLHICVSYSARLCRLCPDSRALLSGFPFILLQLVSFCPSSLLVVSNMQKRRKPEPIQLNPIPDGNTINGTGATE